MGARGKKTQFKTVERPASPKAPTVEKGQDTPQVPHEAELPKPEAIKLSADIRVSTQGQVPTNGGGTVVPPGLPGAPGPSQEVKLDLGCGQNIREGFEGVDLYAKEAKHKVDLFSFPWPWADNSVDEINSSHFIEHIPMTYVCKTHGHEAVPCLGNPDLFFAFFDECWRILKPNGKMHIVCPAVRSERAFQDPTHRRFIAQATFFYLSDVWRKANKLDHYLVKCNFTGDVNFSFSQEIQTRHEEVQKKLFGEAWNVILDWIVLLRAVK